MEENRIKDRTNKINERKKYRRTYKRKRYCKHTTTATSQQCISILIGIKNNARCTQKMCLRVTLYYQFYFHCGILWMCKSCTHTKKHRVHSHILKFTSRFCSLLLKKIVKALQIQQNLFSCRKKSIPIRSKGMNI